MVTGAAAFAAALYGLIRLPETRSKEARQVSRPGRSVMPFCHTKAIILGVVHLLQPHGVGTLFWLLP